MFSFFNCCKNAENDIIPQVDGDVKPNESNNKSKAQKKEISENDKRKHFERILKPNLQTSNITKYNSNNNPDFIDNFNSICSLDTGKIIVPKKFIRSEESGIINYSIEGLLNIIEEFKSLNWEGLYDKDNLVLHYRKSGSPLDQELYFGMCHYTIEKSKLTRPTSIQRIRKIMYDPEVRKSWDKAVKEYKILETDKETGFQVYHMQCYSPAFFISERDLVDKRIEFFKDGTYYNLANSIDLQDYFPEIDEVVRVKNFVNFMIITVDDKGIHYFGLNQVDLKMMVPYFFYNIFLPFKIKSWYDSALEAFNSDLCLEY